MWFWVLSKRIERTLHSSTVVDRVPFARDVILMTCMASLGALDGRLLTFLVFYFHSERSALYKVVCMALDGRSCLFLGLEGSFAKPLFVYPAVSERPYPDSFVNVRSWEKFTDDT